MTTKHDLYLQSKDVVTSLITEDNQHTNIPACPKWTLRDLLGHQTGEIEDGLSGNMDGMGQPHWTSAQVERHRDLNLDAVKHKWTEGLESAGDAVSDVTSGAINDLIHHEFDVRGAVGDTGNRDGEMVTTMFPDFAGFLDQSFRANNLPALKVVTGNTGHTIGEGDPQGELNTSAFEFLRMITGRRSLAQIRAMEWSVDPAPWIDDISLMPPRETDLVE